MLAIGVTYFVMQSLMTYSMKYMTAAMSGILIYITIPVSYLLDYIFFNQQFGTLEIVGACLIVGTNVIIGYLKGRGIIS